MFCMYPMNVKEEVYHMIVKKMYRFTKNGFESALDKDIYTLKLKEWDILCD